MMTKKQLDPIMLHHPLTMFIVGINLTPITFIVASLNGSQEVTAFKFILNAAVYLSPFIVLALFSLFVLRRQKNGLEPRHYQNKVFCLATTHFCLIALCLRSLWSQWFPSSPEIAALEASYVLFMSLFVVAHVYFFGFLIRFFERIWLYTMGWCFNLLFSVVVLFHPIFQDWAFYLGRWSIEHSFF